MEVPHSFNDVSFVGPQCSFNLKRSAIAFSFRKRADRLGSHSHT